MHACADDSKHTETNVDQKLVTLGQAPKGKRKSAGVTSRLTAFMKNEESAEEKAAQKKKALAQKRAEKRKEEAKRRWAEAQRLVNLTRRHDPS